MWHYDLSVIRTHCKNPTQQTWAIIQNFSGWLRIKPNSSDGVTNIFLLLTAALANGRKVDVRVVDNEIVEATLR